MSYDLFAYLSAPCLRPELERAFASAFPKQALEVLSWDARGGQLSIALSAPSRTKAAPVAAIEIVASDVATPALDLPRARKHLLAALRIGYSVSVRGEVEVAAAWLACAALALAGEGFVLDPQEGSTKTATEAKRLAARVAKGALEHPPSEDPLTPEQRAAERLAMFAAELTRRMKDGTFAQLLDAVVLDEALLSQGLALAQDAERPDVSLALARRAPAAVLAAHAVQASRAPGLRSRLYLEHLAEAGALDDLSVETQRAILANAAAQREPALVALLKARRLGGSPASAR